MPQPDASSRRTVAGIAFPPERRSRSAVDAIARRPRTADARCVLAVYRLIARLHAEGLEGLRIVPGMSPSGIHYRASVTHARNVYADHGAIGVDVEQTALHSSASGASLFGWDDAAGAEPSVLARRFKDRFSAICASAAGADRPYAVWFREASSYAERGAFPRAYDDYGSAEHDVGSRWLPTTGPDDGGGLRMPPPGLHAARCRAGGESRYALVCEGDAHRGPVSLDGPGPVLDSVYLAVDPTGRLNAAGYSDEAFLASARRFSTPRGTWAAVGALGLGDAVAGICPECFDGSAASVRPATRTDLRHLRDYQS